MKKNELFTAEFMPHLNELKRFTLRLTGNNVDAEELVYSTVLKVLESTERYTPGTNALAYMCTIAKNLFFNDRKKFKNRKTQLVDAESLRLLELLEEEACLDYFINQLRRYDSFSDPVRTALDEIRNDTHFNVFCSYIDGNKSVEIAKKFNMSENTVKGIIRRIRLKLIPALQDHAEQNFGIVSDIKMQT